MNIKDRTLFIRASEKDAKAVRELWNKWSPKISIFLRNSYGLGDEDREDLHQEIMSKIYNSLASYKQTYSPATWIYTIAKRTVIDWRRKNKSNLKIVGESQLEVSQHYYYSHIPGKYSDPEKIFMQNEDVSLIREFISSQKEKDRQILFLVCYEGLSGRAASRILDIPAETVRDRLKKLKKDLQEEIDETLAT